MRMSSFKLSKYFEGHSNDVRALVSSPQGALYSGSRDKSVLRWSVEDGSPTKVTSLPKYVSSLSLTKEGHLVVGSNDGLIRILAEGEPERVLSGHGLTVSSLHCSQFGTLLSASWDMTVRVWAGDKCTHVFEGHSAAVWAVSLFPESGIVVSGSADKTCKLWKTGVCLKTLSGHSDCVRAVTVCGPKEFLSASNDATIRKWNLDGESLMVFNGHEHYIYSLALGTHGSAFDFVSSGEDRSLRLWKDGAVSQTLFIPAQSIWCVTLLANGDVAAGSSDGKIWIFSCDPQRQASPDALKALEEELATQKLANQTHLGNMKMSDIPGKESLLVPGKQDGATKMVREGKAVSVYSWSASDESWTKIGDVVGAPESSKTIFEGKEYDYVFDIDLDDPPRIIKLPYNTNQDPWTVAQAFIDKNLLPQVYLQEITDFIIKNAKGVTLGGSRSADPFTGGSAYNTCENSGAGAGSGFSGDPFTGSSAYTTPFAAAASSNAPFPQREYLQFGSPPKMEPMLKKLREFNDSFDPPKQLTEEELWRLPDFISQDAAVQEDIDVLIKILRWPLENLFPGLDILRLSVLKESTQSTLLAPTVVGTLLSVCLTSIETGSPANNRLLALRTLVNLFWSPSGLKELQANREAVITRIAAIFPMENKSVEIASATAMLNFAVALSGDEEGQVQAISCILLLFLDGLSEPEALYRSLVALGTLLSYSNENQGYALSLEAKNRLESLKGRVSSEKVSNCADMVLSRL